jgi:hypothetical protein
VPAAHIGKVTQTLIRILIILLLSGAKWAGSIGKTKMRIHLANLDRAKSLSKRMKNLLEPFEADIKLTRCQALISRMFGYSDWHELSKSHLMETPALDDEAVSQTLRLERKATFIARLAECGIEVSVARYVIDAIHPTSARPVAHHTNAEFLSHMSTLLSPFQADSFWLYCEGQRLGKILFRQGGKQHNFPVRRPDLAITARALFSAETGHHPAARTEVTGEFPVKAWRTQWNGRDTNCDMPALFMGQALFRERLDWPEDVPADYWARGIA